MQCNEAMTVDEMIAQEDRLDEEVAASNAWRAHEDDLFDEEMLIEAQGTSDDLDDQLLVAASKPYEAPQFR